MAAPVKKRAVTLKENEDPEEKEHNSQSTSDDSEEEEDMEIAGQEEVQVDFEGRNPIDSDFHGIKQLLNQLFLKAHLNLSELTDIIIGQNYVGSVVKQSEPEEEDSDEDDNDVNDVFGVTTVINLTDKQKLESIAQIRKLLKDLCGKHGSEETNSLMHRLLSGDEKPVGLLINERFINIPAQIVIPLLKSLSCEIKRAIKKKMQFDFAYYILFCKLYKLDANVAKKKSKKNKTTEPDIIWSNPEEEIIDQEVEAKFEYSVAGESDSGLGGEWKASDSEMIPYRRVLLIPATRVDDIIAKVEQHVSQ